MRGSLPITSATAVTSAFARSHRRASAFAYEIFSARKASGRVLGQLRGLDVRLDELAAGLDQGLVETPHGLDPRSERAPTRMRSGRRESSTA